MKHLKKINFLLLILIAFIIGISTSALIHNHNVNSPWWGHLLVVIGTIFLTLTIHELTHAFVFSINKIKIKAVYLFMFMFIRKGKIFTIKINHKLLILGGGLVVPLLPPVTNDEELKEIGNKFAKSLIAAPIVSIVFGFLTFIIFILILLFSQNLTFISLFITATITILILTIFVILASSGANDEAAGDFIAYKRIKENPDYLLQVVSSYILFNEESYKLSKNYLLSKKIEYLKKHPLNYNLVNYSYIIDYLDNVIYEDGERIYDLETRILNLNKSILARTNEGVSILFLISYLLYISGEDKESFELINYCKNINNPKVSDAHLQYELRKSNHLLSISDETEYLSNHKHVDVGLNWIFEPLLEHIKDETFDFKLKKGIKIPKVTFYIKLK